MFNFLANNFPQRLKESETMQSAENLITAHKHFDLKLRLYRQSYQLKEQNLFLPYLHLLYLTSVNSHHSKYKSTQ